MQVPQTLRAPFPVTTGQRHRELIRPWAPSNRPDEDRVDKLRGSPRQLERVLVCFYSS